MGEGDSPLLRAAILKISSNTLNTLALAYQLRPAVVVALAAGQFACPSPPPIGCSKFSLSAQG